ncbi:exodeoxyribonuclease III [Rhizobium sp. DKSPLA3]|uniref:Exodeoxyribonuclease III n=1 Tax=Rhizobium quercicola TaxID=2901226 RepID=A0A9X1NTF2_9HYPH|nr:exodeoxyribonuclease III [Rhizobium quercicola]MCD7110015.1 exodeoxyribonuclease III [Rhizobium quercicola]
MRIATYNVNGINGRLDILLRWLKESRPDIVCLQELKAPQARFPEKALEKAGYGAVWHGQKAWNGVAILARGSVPVLARRGLPDRGDDAESRYIEVITGGVIVGCLYAPNGNPYPGPKFARKLDWFRSLTRYGETLLEFGMPAALIGDFNVMPTDLDVYNPARWQDDALFRPEIRKAYRDLVATGWTDAVRALHPDEQIFTFWKYLRNAFARNAGLRIDHCLLSPDLAPHLTACGVDRHVRGWDKTSDHAPVWVELSL